MPKKKKIDHIQTEFDFTFESNPAESKVFKTKKYNITNKRKRSWQKQIKSFTISPINQKYIDSFRNNRYPLWESDPKQKASWLQYKSSISSFLEFIGDIDVVNIDPKYVHDFIAPLNNSNTRANKTAHLKSFLTFLVKHNISGCNSRISKEVLIMIIGM